MSKYVMTIEVDIPDEWIADETEQERRIELGQIGARLAYLANNSELVDGVKFIQAYTEDEWDALLFGEMES